uniref:Transposase Tc1-like domain-containing protein n=1 Tax=Poecilia latipinna TaxID=48699 RepID=A0A3B3V7E9_9TELE
MMIMRLAKMVKTKPVINFQVINEGLCLPVVTITIRKCLKVPLWKKQQWLKRFQFAKEHTDLAKDNILWIKTTVVLLSLEAAEMLSDNL